LVDFKESISGNMESYDEKLDNDVFIYLYKVNELWRYFMCNLKPPTQIVQIHGFHDEWRRTSDGRRRVQVDDFNFCIEMTRFVSPAWSRIICQPKKNQESKSFKQTLQEYATSERSMKEIHLKKQVICDFEGLSVALHDCVKRTGYQGQISIQFLRHGDDVSAYSSTFLSRMAHNTLARVLCVLTCLWTLFLPIYCCMR
jgi:hypothetical protein